MVRIHFFIVPAAVADFRINRRLRQQIRRMNRDGIKNRMPTGKMLLRQIAAVRTRIGNQFVGFIQFLADIQHVLRAKAKALRRLNLQRRKRKRQRRRLRIPLIVVGGHPRRLALNARHHVFGQRTMQQTPLFILIRFAGIARHPGGNETLILRRHDMRLDVKEIFGDEILNLFITPHDQPQHRRLHPPDRQHPLVAGIAAEQRIGAGHVNPVQPVGAGAGQGRNAQRNKLAVGAQTSNRPLHRLRVEIVNQAALNLLALFWRQLQIVENFVYQQLPLSVRVTGVNHLLRIAQQTLDDVELFGDRRFGLQLPLLRHNRQVEQIPARIAPVIDVRLSLLEQMADTPGDHLPVTALNVAITFAMRFGEHVGDCATETGFFRNKQPHVINGSRSWDVRRVRSPARR